MTRPRGWSRRAFVGAGLACGGTLLAGVPLHRCRTTAPAPEGDARALGGLLSQRESASVIGRAYLAQRPEEADPAALVRALLAHGPDSSRAAPGQLRRWMAERLSRDFADGHVVSIDGWVLAVSEARLCALVVLGTGRIR